MKQRAKNSVFGPKSNLFCGILGALIWRISDKKRQIVFDILPFMTTSNHFCAPECLIFQGERLCYERRHLLAIGDRPCMPLKAKHGMMDRVHKLGQQEFCQHFVFPQKRQSLYIVHKVLKRKFTNLWK